MTAHPHTQNDRGFSLVELLVVVFVLGVLGAITVFTVRGIAERSEENACAQDGRILSQAAEVYLSESGLTIVPATGVGDNRYEQTLIDEGLLKEVSTYYNLAADGSVVTSGQPCP